MIKYSFLLHSSDYEDFLSSLQDLGMVDITISGWEPTEQELALLHRVEKQRQAMLNLYERAVKPNRVKAAPFSKVEEALDHYIRSTERLAKLDVEITKAEKETEDAKVWGVFDLKLIKRLEDQDIKFNFYSAFTKDFNASLRKWREHYIVTKISESIDKVYFVILTTHDSPPITIDAIEIKAPDVNYVYKEHKLEGLLSERNILDRVLDRCAESFDELKEYGSALRAKLYISKIKTTAATAAEGSLIIMEGWATEETQKKVDSFIEPLPVVVMKDSPTKEDNPPVLLKNNKFAKLFEVIGGLYAPPRYGGIDLTPFFAPFYMLFFGFCLGDAGYGALFIIGALFAYNRVKPDLKPILKLVMYCASSAIFFGLITGNVFGIRLADLQIFFDYKDYFLTADGLFPLAIGLGIFQILYAMVLKIFLITKTQGFKYSFPTIGWIMVILSGLSVFLLPKIGFNGYSADSIAFMCITGAGLFCMLFLNSPGKNPLVNFGTGLWNTYNDVTGFLGDVLSYIRLFALGLSGGILALVFNKLAVGMSPDIIVVKQIVMVIILVAGQGINLFMATLSSFVHPLRLTFVEFYKNAGFEAGSREFNPLRRDSE